jgi:hypothetical protein
MKYRYIIWDSFDGNFKGTNCADTANDFSENDDFAVYDTERGMWIVEGEEHDIVPLIDEENNDD